jgi:hypothetical protein
MWMGNREAKSAGAPRSDAEDAMTGETQIHGHCDRRFAAGRETFAKSFEQSDLLFDYSLASRSLTTLPPPCSGQSKWANPRPDVAPAPPLRTCWRHTGQCLVLPV